MAYIRTYNTIYKISKILKNGSILIKGKFHIDKCMTEDFKQADTIEELCDEFVIFDKEQPNGKLLYYKGFENLKNEFINFENDKCKVKIYGAIWVDKGLIYVAKMNKKGELVLL